jgi:hypothetical protein
MTKAAKPMMAGQPILAPPGAPPGARSRSAAITRPTDWTNWIMNSRPVTAAPSTMMPRNGQMTKVKSPGTPVISFSAQASTNLGNVPSVMSTNTLAPSRWNSAVKPWPATGRLVSSQSIRISARVKRPTCSVLGNCRNTAVTIE